MSPQPDLHLTLTRTSETPERILGEMRANGAFLCYTLERPSDGLHPCIPEGAYQVGVDFSSRFQRQLPHVLDVPGRAGIRIHPGNHASDSEGCILVGLDRSQDAVLRSREAMAAVMQRLSQADAATLSIQRAAA